MRRMTLLARSLFALGLLTGTFTGSFYGDSETQGYAAVAPGPGAVVLMGQSGAGGVDVVTNATSFPGIDAPYPAVQLTRRGASLNATPTWFSESKKDLQPRVTQFGSFPIGSHSLELKMGRDLDAASGGVGGWSIIQHFLDGSSLAQNWLNPAYPTGQPQLLTQAFTEIDTQLVALGTTVKAVVWFQGEADSNTSPDNTNYYANLVTLFDKIRRKYGDVAIVIVRLSSNYGSDAQSQPIRDAQESFVAGNPRARIITGDELPFIDLAHYTANANCTLGARAAAAILEVVNSTAAPAWPRYMGCGARIVATSGTPLGPVPWPLVHAANDIGILVVSATGANPFAVPAGWTQMPDSPQYSGVALSARLHVYWKRATSNAEAAVTFANPASGDSKVGVIFTIRGCAQSGNPYDVTAGDTSAANTVVTFPGDTTTVNNCLIVHILAHGVDLAVPQLTGWTNADLTLLTEQVDVDNTSSQGYGIAIATGVKAVLGAFTTTTATLANSDTQARWTGAFRP